MKRWVTLCAAIIFQLCLGGVYAWSYFIPHLEREFNISATRVQPIFGVCIFVFTLSMIAGGRLLPRHGPRRIAIVGAFCYACAYFGAALSNDNFWLLFLFKGILEGIGIGLGYVCPLTTALHWFPKHKGIVTGLVVGGFGSGAIVLSYTASYLQAFGLSLSHVFTAIGFGYLLTAVLAGALLFLPTTDPNKQAAAQFEDQDRAPSLGQILSHKSLLILTSGMFAGTFGGLLVIGSLNPIALDGGLSTGQAILAISIFSAGNSLGRVIWGSLIDRFGEITIPISLFLLSGSVISLLPNWNLSPAVFIFATGITGFAFAACFVLYATQTAFFFKPELVGSIYPVMFFFGYGLSGIVGPGTGSLLQYTTSGHSMPIAAGAFICLLGAVFTLLHRSTLKPDALQSEKRGIDV